MQVKESAIEQDLIAKLGELKYTLRPDIRDRTALERNFLEKFEALNRVYLTTNEYQRLLDEIVTADVFTAAQRLRETSSFTRDDGTPLHYTLVNTRDWCKNTFEVVNQLRINHDSSHHRYDVILLINGVPVVQIELKTLGISPRRAMQQIVDYKADPGNGYTRTLLCFIQLFIVSNRTETCYFANNNPRHFNFSADEQFLPVYQYADEANRKIAHLDAFADTFLAKCTLGQMLSRYMVLVANEQKLLMMRPYQIYAVKAIVDCIDKNGGNGYVWHTTGSGKTLTSFKASTLLKDNPDIEKCLFVVDRKDLDRQTREEFNRFQEGCVEENTNTEALVRRLVSDDKADKVIVTTIQKLGLALDGSNKRNYAQRLAPLRDKRLVFIFDECHRSQFGDNHQAIKEFFPRAQLFGFTGTPIFNENAASIQREGEKARLRTTLDLFQRELHAYTITHAIDDRNVLKFHVDHFKPEGTHPPKPGEAPLKQKVIETILEKHDAATAQRRFNAVFATASINDAIEYYQLFGEIQVERQAHDPDFRPLKIACVFSPPAQAVAAEGGDEAARNAADVRQLQEDLPQEQADNREDPEGKYAALKQIIADYNACYGGNFRIGEFDAYYKDVQQRIKLQQIRPLLQRYVDFDFQIDTAAWVVRFYRRDNPEQPIKISRGEETMFLWCFFLAIVELAMEGAEAYKWVKYIVIDDPISSLDEHNAITVGNHLAQFLRRKDHDIKTVISTHHPLFFNVLWNEIKSIDQKKFIPWLLSKNRGTGEFALTYTRDTPFFHHLALLQELCHARQSGQVYTHHFNALRGLLEKAQIFHGHDKFSVCIKQDANDDPDATLYGRVVNIMSHGNYSFYDPVEMLQENKEHFEKVLDDFLAFYPFNRAEFPGDGELVREPTTEESSVVQIEAGPAVQEGPAR